MKVCMKNLIIAFLAMSVVLLLAASFSSNKQNIPLIADSLHGGAVSTSDLTNAASARSSLIYEPFELDAADRKQLNYIAKKHKAVGVSVAVIQDGIVTNHYEYGWADKEKGVKMTSDHKLRVASISKPVITMAYMTLCDSGTVTPDTTMGELFGKDKKYADLTMRSMMSHASGISDANSVGSRIICDTLSEELELKNIFVSKPYASWRYSNLGFDTVGAAVEKASGQLFQDYTAKKFFTPMNIDASWDGSYIKSSDLIATTYSAQHVRSLSKESLSKPLDRQEAGENYDYMAGGLIISSVDLARVYSILINDGNYMGDSYLSEESVDAIHTVQDINTGKNFSQCLGVRYAENFCNGHDMYFHPGNAYGVLSLVAYDPSDGSGVVIITTGAERVRDKYLNFTVCSDILKYIYKNIID